MSRITDNEEIRSVVLDAFKNPTGPIIVTRGESYPTNLRSQLNIKSVHPSDVCRIVNQLVEEGVLERTETKVDAYGSGSEPIPLKAAQFALA